MDNERRHQLQQNELSDQLDRAKTWIEPYVVPILIGVIGVTLVGIVVNFLQSQRSSSRSEATLDLLFSTAVGPTGEEDPEVLDRVSKNFAGTIQAQMALISKADILLAQGISALYSDRSEAETLLGDAATAYGQVLETTDVELLKSRAQFGLAQTLESQGKIEEAIAAYEKLIQLKESEKMIEVAQSRISLLKRADTQAFASWFGEQTPQAFDPTNRPGLPGLDQLPGMPDIQLPGVDFGLGDGAGAGSSETTTPLGGLLQGPLSSGTQPLTGNDNFVLPEGDAPAEVAPEDPAPTEPGDGADNPSSENPQP